MSEETERAWAKLDRKATAIAEFTLRTRCPTPVHPLRCVSPYLNDLD